MQPVQPNRDEPGIERTSRMQSRRQAGQPGAGEADGTDGITSTRLTKVDLKEIVCK
jgi:hypothetical protein